MNKKTFVCMVMVVLLTISGCGNTLYRKNIRDYTNVTSIEGLKFELPSDVLENCTMISEIDQDIDYSDGTYLYKNGTDTYILFNINAVVIAVQKGTSFSLSNSENKQESIMNHSVCDIWMSPVKNKIKYKSSKSNDAFKLIADVKGNVCINIGADLIRVLSRLIFRMLHVPPQAIWMDFGKCLTKDLNYVIKVYVSDT